MEFLNKIELKGVVGRVTMQTFGGTLVCNFSVVTEYAYTDKNGLKTIETLWLSCFAAAQKENEFPNLVRGDKVHVIGRLRCRKYADEYGRVGTLTEVIVKSVEKIEEEGQIQINQSEL